MIFGVFLDICFSSSVYVCADSLVENKRRISNYSHKPDFYKKYLNNLISLLGVIENNEGLRQYESLQHEIIKDILDRHLYKYLRVHKRMGGEINQKLRASLKKYCTTSKKNLVLYACSYVPNFVVKFLFTIKNIYRKNA